MHVYVLKDQLKGLISYLKSHREKDSWMLRFLLKKVKWK
jgi:hypothetical protein